MATEKLAEGIRNFVQDQERLESLLRQQIEGAAKGNAAENSQVV
jgi:transaldolase